MPILSSLLLLLATSTLSEAQSQPPGRRLLNAYYAPLSALTAPHSHYFLEFPISTDDDEYKNATSRPQCANGSPYSFLFRRGSDAHMNKLLVEFEGAASSSSSSSATSAPWHTLHTGAYYADDNTIIPPLGTCQGISYGFISRGASLLGFDTTSDNGDVDVPIFLRRGQKDNGSNSTATMPSKVWWERLSGEYSSMHDWSYLFVPHCTPGEEGIATANVQHVSDWVTTQFALEGGGLDALITISGGGKIGGCSSPPTTASFAVSFAKDASTKGLFRSTSSKALVIMDGSTLWNDITLEDSLQDALSSEGVEVAWVVSSNGSADSAITKEDVFFQTMKQTFPHSFHIHRPSANDENDKTGESCPLYAFPDVSADDDFLNFLDTISKNMPWAKNAVKDEEDKNNAGNNGRLSFLAIVLIIFGVYLASWVVYFTIKYHRQRQGANQEAAVLSPHDMWFLALTKFPIPFLLMSIAIPVILSYVAYARNGYTVSVNLDFETYLDITTKEELSAIQYRSLLEYQKDSLKEEESNCQELYSGIDKQSVFDPKMERLLEETNEMHYHHHHHEHRGLQRYDKRIGRTVISFFYENRNGGTVFTPEVLESIQQFELNIMSLPGFVDLCYEPGPCFPFDSIAPYFYPDGENLVDDIDGVLRSFPGSKNALAKMDKYFSKDNLGSNITLTNIMLNDIRGTNQDNVRQFLELLHRELWAADLSHKYPDLIFSWRNNYMSQLEADAALQHDFKWSAIALCFIGLMVFVKVLNVVAVLAGVLGLVLSFTSAFYWQFHFNFNELTALHVAGIFVMLGIGADDIFLTIDSFEHTKVDYPSLIDGEQQAEDDMGSEAPKRQLDDPEIIKKRIVSAYKTAGSMMLVSSMTAALCFFSNIFSAVVSIRDFGSYMGMVVVCNYVHVMTILPSALLVNELHIKPLQRKAWAFFCSKSNNEGDESTETAPTNTNGVSMRIIPSLAICETPTQKDEEDILAETAVSLLSSQSEIRHENGPCAATPETITPSNVDTEDSLQSSDDNFLHQTREMTALDRFFVEHYAPNVYRWRCAIISTSLTVALVLGFLAWLNFSLYDGTIIVFKEKYNLGRVQRIVDQYFPEGLIKLYLDEGLDLEGNIDLSSVDLGSVSDAFGGSSMSGIFDADGPAAPMPSPLPSSHPSLPLSTAPSSTPMDSQEQNITVFIPSLPPASRPPLSSVSAGSNSIFGAQEGVDSGINNSTGGSLNVVDLGIDGNQVPPPITATTNNSTTIAFENPPTAGTPANNTASTSSVWYPNWTGDSRGCLNDGKQTAYMIENSGYFLFDTLAGCCDVNFAWDPNPMNCLGIDIMPPPSTIPSVSNSSSAAMIDTPTGHPSLSYPPTSRLTTLPANPPTKSSTTMPTTSIQTSLKPTSSPTNQELDFNCPPGLSCIQTGGETNNFKKREYYWASMVWGMRPVSSDPNVWIIRDNSKKRKDEAKALKNALESEVDPSEPFIQEWLLEVVTLARNDMSLRLHPQLVWIEALKDFAVQTGVGFPIQKDMFIGVVELAKSKSIFFRKLVERELATKSPGIAGEYFYSSVTLMSEVPLTGDTSDVALKKWTNFTQAINGLIPKNLPPVDVQSDEFLASLRTTAIVDSTVSSYFFANGLFLLIVLLFSRNLLLTLMIMISLLAIFLCCGGFIFVIFQIEFGPVESLGVSIFVGLSSNYLLHIMHAYHKSKIKERSVKIQRAVFVVGSPIVWSAVSTIGGSAFLFACRTWLLTELGILICTVIGLSLIFSLGFLLALLACIGPLPIASDDGKHRNLHSCDLMSISNLLSKCLCKGKSDQEVTSVEVVERAVDQSEIAPVEVEQSEVFPYNFSQQAAF